MNYCIIFSRFWNCESLVFLKESMIYEIMMIYISLINFPPPVYDYLVLNQKFKFVFYFSNVLYFHEYNLIN